MLNIAYIALSLLHIRVHCLRERIQKLRFWREIVGQLIIASIRSLEEGNVFSRVCLPVQRMGGGIPV